MTYMAIPWHKNPWPRVIKLTIQVDLGHHYLKLSLSELCLEVEKKIFKEIMHFHYILLWPHLRTRTTAPGVMKYSIQVDPSLVITDIHVHLISVNHAWYQSQEDLFLRNTSTFHFLPQNYLPCHLSDSGDLKSTTEYTYIIIISTCHGFLICIAI